MCWCRGVPTARAACCRGCACRFAAFFPPYMSTLGIEQGYIAPIFSSFTVANVVGSVISAPLATRIGRQPVHCAPQSTL